MPASRLMPESRTYQRSFHCSNVRCEATLELGSVMACNCSMCQCKGSLLTFIPATQFRLVSEEAPLAEYRFNRKQIRHLFCPTLWHPLLCPRHRPGRPAHGRHERALSGGN
jgi:hypothetical protein